MKRVWKNYSREGPQGLIFKKRGNPSNNQLSMEIKNKVLLIRQRYLDYGPTLIKEKLEEKYKIKVAKETIRQLMIKEGLWISKKVKAKGIYARRTRRSKFGELIQCPR